MLLMPALALWLPPLSIPILPVAPQIAVQPTEDLPLAAAPAVVAAKAPEPRLVPWLAICYLAGFLVLAVRMALAWMLIRRMVNRSAPVPGFANVRESDSVQVPVTVGPGRTVVLLPAAWREWSEWKLRTVLAHEFAHIERKDTWIAALAAVNCCIFWFHPLAWWLKNKIADCAEHAADDASILASGDRGQYAELLLEVASGVTGSRRVMGVAMARRSQVGNRIHRILDDTRRLTGNITWRGWALLIGAAAPLVCAAAAMQAVQRTPPGPTLQGAMINAPKDEIGTLEARVRVNPDDVEARAKLASLYFATGNREGHFANVLWLVEHRPDIPPGRFPAEPIEDHEKITEAWLKQVELNPAGVQVLINAAEWMRSTHPDQAESLLKRARQVNPSDPAPGRRLAGFYSNIIETSGSSDKAERIVKELSESNDALVVGTVGRTLTNSLAAPSVYDTGNRLLERARALEPNNPAWKADTAAASPALMRIRVGGNVQQSKLKKKVNPVYPPLAKQARIQGTVRFNVIISKDGKVQNLTVISGHPLLIPAATDAVKQWEYEQTFLNGQPVEVVTQVDVNFTLAPGGEISTEEVPAPPPANPPLTQYYRIMRMPDGAEFPRTEGVQRIRVGQTVQAAKLVNAPTPEYPPLAKQARIQGRVQLLVLIDKSGKVTNTILIAGHPLLTQAAIDAVKQYQYSATLLNGDPVEVVTYVDVNFQLP
jgi:TonB family protein